MNVVFKNFSFDPPALTVQVGDTVVFTNAGGAHTVTGLGSEPFCGPNAVSATCSVTFSQAGTYPYQCNFHAAQGMMGAITVSSSSATNPPSALTILSPTNGATISITNALTIIATNMDGSALSQVEYFSDGGSLGVVTTAPFTLTVGLGAGKHSLTAAAASAGVTNTSAAVQVTVKNEIEDPIPRKIPKSSLTIELQPVIDGAVSPLGLAVPDDGSKRLLVYDQVGLIYVVQNGVKMNDPLLDAGSRLVKLNPGYDERGLLGVATHPNFAQHPLVYTYTSEPPGPMADFAIPMPNGKTNNNQSVIAEWHVDAVNTNRLDPASRRELLRLDKPEANHNAGCMRFGPDGFLYFTVGDGGAADDQGPGHLDGGNAQNKGRILGKVLRIDVDTRTSANGQYGIPTDNPFVGQPGVVQEIYAYGLRNPFSFSFDRQTGDLLLGDVGQNQIEEVDRITKGGNFGWSIKEGSFLFNANGTNNGFVTQTPVREVPADLIDPITEYDHDEGDAVIGGYMYRGTAMPSLQGKYITGDLGQADEGKMGRLFVWDGSQLEELRIGIEDRALGLFLKGFGQDSDGELYVFGSTNIGPTGTVGMMLKIVAGSSNSVSANFIVQKLISDIPGNGSVVDPNLVNPWGLAFSPTGPFWVADNHSGLSTVYNTTGGVQTLVVAIPAPPGATSPAAPTGILFNSTTNFALPEGPARFIFVTEDGTISAWASGSNAVLKADNFASGAVYKGAALGVQGSSNLLYAANFHAGTIDVFDGNFAPVNLTNAFKDPLIPNGFAPFNIANLKGNLYVTYAKQNDEQKDDVAGPGNGFVDVYDTSGTLLKQLISMGVLNAPWGLAIAPAGFGSLGGSLLVGNFGDGAIHAFNATNGDFTATLKDPQEEPVQIKGLWAIEFGNGGTGGDSNTLYFTSGPDKEEHGLFGSLTPATVGTPGNELKFTTFSLSPTNLVLNWTGGTAPYLIQRKPSLADTNWTDVMTTTNTTTTVDLGGGTGFFRLANPVPNSVKP